MKGVGKGPYALTKPISKQWSFAQVSLGPMDNHWFWICSTDLFANDITSSHGLLISPFCEVNNKLSLAIHIYEYLFGASNCQYFGLYSLILTLPSSLERADSMPLA